MTSYKPTRRNFLRVSAAAMTCLALAPMSESSSSTYAPRGDSTSISKGIDLCSLTLTEAATRIRKKELSPVEPTQAVLDRINLIDPKVGAFITVVVSSISADFLPFRYRVVSLPRRQDCPLD